MDADRPQHLGDTHMILPFTLTAVTAVAVAVGLVAVMVAADATSQRDRALAALARAEAERHATQVRCRRLADGTPAQQAAARGLPAVASVAGPLLELDTIWPDPPPPAPESESDDVTVEAELLPLLPDGMKPTGGPGQPTPDLHTHPPAPVIPVPPADRRRTLPLIGTPT